ncbi:MAG: hypothetical protein II675_00650 [Bacteroidaceae bacterium]|nr:hypothetical protein [Bacteroidaceae bacterium]
MERLTQNFIDNPEPWHIASDFFWHDAPSDALLFLAMGGTYAVEVDKAARTLLAFPVDENSEKDGLFLCGQAKSVGRVFYYPGTLTLSENALPMAETEPGLYQCSLTDGLRDASDRCYNLAGQQVGNHRFTKGVYIVGNKKVVVR